LGIGTSKACVCTQDNVTHKIRAHIHALKGILTHNHTAHDCTPLTPRQHYIAYTKLTENFMDQIYTDIYLRKKGETPVLTLVDCFDSEAK
jgi:hypothetical protein